MMPTARVYLRAGGWFFPSCQKLLSLLPNCWRSIFNVFVKNQRWQIDLPNSWRCSKVVKLYIQNKQTCSIFNPKYYYKDVVQCIWLHMPITQTSLPPFLPYYLLVSVSHDPGHALHCTRWCSSHPYCLQQWHNKHLVNIIYTNNNINQNRQ